LGRTQVAPTYGPGIITDHGQNALGPLFRDVAFFFELRDVALARSVSKSLSSGEATLYPRRSLYKKGEILKILTKILLLIGDSF
jgi:hypothetical protein